ncbi:MAG: delta-60 repeat domain-containing protein [bacterium]
MNRVARLNTDGSLDTSFNPGTANHLVRSFSLQSDGKILIA